MRFVTLAVAGAALIIAGCSEQTQENAEELAVKAAADAKANAEVVENAAREKTIEVADTVSAELKEDEQTDPDQGDGKLDGAE